MAKSITSELRKRAKTQHKVQEKKLASIQNREWYSLRSLLGNDLAMFFVIIGAREAGKSYDAMKYVLRQWKKYHKPFYWLRLTEPSTKKLLMNNAADFVDADLRRKFQLDLTVKGSDVYDGNEKMATILALSTYYNDKGIAHFDCEFDLGYNIVLDEMNRERCEKNTFDITYAFVNQMENLIRSTKTDVKIIMIGNDTIEASDILCCFNFIPEEFGRYTLIKNKKKLRAFITEFKACKTPEEKKAVNLKYKDVDFGKRAIIEYIPNNDAYKARRHGTVSNILTPTDSNVTNKQDVDRTLIDKRKRKQRTAIIKFTSNKSSWFTIWDGNIVCSWNNDYIKQIIPMRKFLDAVFVVETRDNIIQMYDSRSLRFRDLITQKKFKKELQLLKGSKY